MATCQALIALSFVAAIASAQIPDLSGTWRLNVQKSNWGKHPKPSSGKVVIEHHEPQLKYTGTISVNDGGETAVGNTNFSFDGAIDGKEYPVAGTDGPLKMSIRRVSPASTISELKSNDGTVLETAKTTISPDGKRMTREMKAVAPGGDVSWMEIYDRQ